MKQTVKRIQLIIVFFLFFGVLFCNSQKRKTDNCSSTNKNNHKKTIIYGKVINQTADTPKVIVIYTEESFSQKSKYAIRLDDKGKFKVEFEMLWGHNFFMSYYKKAICAYANPGDSIYIEIDAAKHNNYKEFIHFGGDNSKRNKELSQTFNNFSNIINYRLFQDMNLSVDEFMKIFNKERIRINNEIAVYCKKNNISQWTQNLVQDMKLYSLANLASHYYDGKSSEKALAFFTNPIFDIYNDKKFRIGIFKIHLYAYYDYMVAIDSKIKSKYKAKDFLEVEKLALKKLLKLSKCLTRDFMIAELYYRIKGVQKNIDKNIFYNKDVYKRVLELQKPLQTMIFPKIESKKEVSYLTSEGKVENIINFNLEKWIKEKYKGKVVYMDIWAIWCGNCLREIEPAKKLHKLFEGKNVAFINICMLSPKEEWIKKIKELKVSGENYHFDSDLSLEADVKISRGYPTYILIDKHGKIRNTNSPRPSNLSKTKKEIEKLLNEK